MDVSRNEPPGNLYVAPLPSSVSRERDGDDDESNKTESSKSQPRVVCGRSFFLFFGKHQMKSITDIVCLCVDGALEMLEKSARPRCAKDPIEADANKHLLPLPAVADPCLVALPKRMCVRR